MSGSLEAVYREEQLSKPEGPGILSSDQVSFCGPSNVPYHQQGDPTETS